MKIDVNVPDGQSGEWKIESFTVIEDDLLIFNLRASVRPGCRRMKPGTYKRLMRGREVIMSNTPAEIGDFLEFVYRAKRIGGHILINGLGLGVVLKAILESDKVEKVTVIEKSIDVIKLVGPVFDQDERVYIIHDDAFKYKPQKGVRYSLVWHDIWDNICGDNLPEMTKLHRKYGGKTDFQDSWCKSLCRQ